MKKGTTERRKESNEGKSDSGGEKGKDFVTRWLSGVQGFMDKGGEESKPNREDGQFLTIVDGENGEG